MDNQAVTKPHCPFMEALMRLSLNDICIADDDGDADPEVYMQPRQIGEYYKKEDVINLLNAHSAECNFKG